MTDTISAKTRSTNSVIGSFTTKSTRPLRSKFLSSTPNGFRIHNVWDSLGEVYYQIGKLEEAIKYYEKSLQINPKNEGGKRTLERIRRGEKP